MRLAVAIEIGLSRHGARLRDPTKGENTWNDVVDTSVYSSGLRPPGCAKSIVCEMCGKSKLGWRHGNHNKNVVVPRRAPCKDQRETEEQNREADTESANTESVTMSCCVAHQRKPQGYRFPSESVYVLTRVFHQGVFEDIDRTLYQIPPINHERSSPYDLTLMHLASIRCSPGSGATPGFRPNEDVRAAWNCLPPGARGGNAEALQKLPAKRPYEIKSENKPFIVDHQLSISGHLKARLESMVRGSGLSNHYQRIVITKVVGFPGNKDTWLPAIKGESRTLSLYREVVMCTTGEGSRFCLKKGAEHNSNTIKFHLNKDGILVQSCWSAKVHRYDRPCKSYTSLKEGKYFKLESPAHLELLKAVMTSPLIKSAAASGGDAGTGAGAGGGLLLLPPPLLPPTAPLVVLEPSQLNRGEDENVRSRRRLDHQTD
jgi:hypothetical protein